MKKINKLTRSDIIKRLDRLRQTYARYDGAKKVKGEWVNTCVTCGKRLPCDKQNGGHFCSRTCYPLRWDKRNVNCQCLTEESKLILTNGEEKSIKDIEVGDIIRAFNEVSYNKEPAKVLSTASFVPEELYKVELEDGFCFYATPDHRIVVNGKWARIDELLHSCVDNDILEI